MIETKIYTLIGVGLLLFIRTIINNSIFNSKDKTNYSIFTNNGDIESILHSLKVAFVFWIKTKKEYRTKAFISNIMYLLAIAMFIYFLYLKNQPEL